MYYEYKYFPKYVLYLFLTLDLNFCPDVMLRAYHISEILPS